MKNSAVRSLNPGNKQETQPPDLVYSGRRILTHSFNEKAISVSLFHAHLMRPAVKNE